MTMMMMVSMTMVTRMWMMVVMALIIILMITIIMSMVKMMMMMMMNFTALFFTAPGGPPRNIRAWGVSDTSFGASWLPPLELNGRLEMYHLIYSTDLEKDYSQWRFKPEARNYTVVEGLKPVTTYYFRMVAYTRVGRSPPTKMFVVKTGKGG